MIEKQPAILFAEETVRERVKELARRISEDYAGVEELLLVGILRGCYMFLADLSRLITIPRCIDFMAVSSYGHDTTRGTLRLIMDTRNDIAGKHVLIIEDIVDTGHTVHYLLENLATRRPASIKLASLLHKPERAERQVTIDYLGFTIPNKFVVGYGLDVAQKWRNLPFIGYVPG